jgi:glycerate kinase
MTTDEMIAAFGGRDVVMEITGAARNAVNNWRHDGVPYKHHKALIEAAERRGIAGITLCSLHATRTTKQAA